MPGYLKNVGAIVHDSNTCTFRVWAPGASRVSVYIEYPEKILIYLVKEELGYWSTKSTDIKPGSQFYFKIDDKRPLPDPASRFQPNGVHAASEIVDLKSYKWTDDNWNSISLENMILYELHTGTFSEESNFLGIEKKLDYLLDLGINTIELMPVAQFPGKRNWGYDGVYPFAVQNSYGGPFGLMKLVDACHNKGIAVILDVVYNHLGPEGNYLAEYAPYFTEKYKTPWGLAINFDDRYSDGVRNYVIQNALMWFRNFHIDGLRLDAIHAIYDFSANHIMKELAVEVKKLNKATGKRHYLIAESNLNDNRYINGFDKGGYGLDAQWNDDFHHSIHTLSTREKNGYYIDFMNPVSFSKSFSNGFVYDGQYSEFRKKHFGNSPEENLGKQFIVFSQNHDQVGNRKLGERLSTLVSFEKQKLIAGAMFVSPFVPMLFMGEEYGEQNPFLYFVNHNDENLNKLVREGRQNEFQSFYAGDDTLAPDPADIRTFEKSRLTEKPLSDKHSKALFEYYQNLIDLRKNHPVLKFANKNNINVTHQNNLYFIYRWENEKKLVAWLNFNAHSLKTELPNDFNEQVKLILNSSDKKWRGLGTNVPDKLSLGDELSIPEESILIYSN